MFKGLYVLLPVAELKDKISKYLDTDGFTLDISNQRDEDIIIENTGLILRFPKKDENKTLELLKKIIGEDNEYSLEQLLWAYEDKPVISLIITECSFMLSQIFDIQEKVIFDDEAMFANEDEDVYLYYTIAQQGSSRF